MLLIIQGTFSCKRIGKPTTTAPNSENSSNTFEKLSKTWLYVSDNIYVHGRIELKADSTFYYESGGCLGVIYSAGKWTLQGNTIVLNTVESYEPKTVNTPPPYIDIKRGKSMTHATSSSSTGSETLTLNVSPSSTSITSCNTFLSDSCFVYIKDRVLIFENDTLYELNDFMGSRNGTKYRTAMH
jgi:hypothetical protein